MKKAVAVILAYENKILLHLRDNNPGIVHPGVWAFIGGAIENNETEIEAAKRETMEELECEIKNLKLLKTLYLSNYDVLAAIFSANLDALPNKINEGIMIKLFDLEEIEKLNMPKVLKETLFENKHKIFSLPPHG